MDQKSQLPSPSPQHGGTSPRRLWLLVVIIALAAVGALAVGKKRSSAETQGPSNAVAFNNGRLKLLDFGMGICDQCKRMKVVMDKMSQEFSDRVDVHVLDIREPANEKLAERYNMRVIPLILIVDDQGAERYRHEGFIDHADLAAALTDKLSRRLK